jgi:hypothetical protein
MTHQSDTATLRSRAEESNLGLVATQLLGKGQHGLPGSIAARVPVVLDGGEMRTEGGIGLDDTTPSDLQNRDERWSEVPIRLG